ncbi:MAG: hypothetical protein E7273_11925 [Pseudobutyrivibrio ruminis]|nr:hypothetical protein [Pseudobutyrivibrio ruminis]
MANETELSTNETGNQIAELKLQLSSPHSPIGDWKLAKIMEYRLLGYEDPYDLDELAKERQKIRDQINELEGNQVDELIKAE